MNDQPAPKPEPEGQAEPAKPISRNEQKRQKRAKKTVPHWQTLNSRPRGRV